METYLRELVAMPTVSSDQDANNLALDYLQTFFDDRGLHCMRYSFNGYGALVATTKKDDKNPKILLGAHLDVVPGTKELFELREDSQNYYGRGVFDMKFAIAAYMELIDQLGDAAAEYSLGVMITTDEELGGANGVNRLVDMGLKPDVCILPDGAENWEIEVLAKGLYWIQLAIEGKAAHGSRPWEGDSASFRLLDLLQEIKQVFAQQAPMTDTLNIGKIEAGEAVNQVPAYATADLDIRYLSADSLITIQDSIARACKKYGATMTEKVSGVPCVNDLNNPHISAFKSLIEEHVGILPKGTVAYGGTDGRFFSEIGVPCIISSPVGGDRHAATEWMSKESFAQYAKILELYVRQNAHN